MCAPWCITGCPSNIFKPHAKYKHRGGQPRLCFVGISWKACEAREYGSESKQKHQVEGAIMQAKEWMRTFGRCTRSRSALEKNRA
jgi:hypothetical protein